MTKSLSEKSSGPLSLLTRIRCIPHSSLRGLEVFRIGSKGKLFWIPVLGGVAALSAGSSVLFLRVLEMVTQLRESHLWLIGFLPLGGYLTGRLYELYGAGTEGGTALVLSEARNPKRLLPLRMSPLIFLSASLTHLFGGSAGREGVAVQMGAALADVFSRLRPSKISERRLLLLCGMSSGFAALFGTPLAGTCFALEVGTASKHRASALIPCLMTSFLAHRLALHWGAKHTLFAFQGLGALTMESLGRVAVGAVFFGMAGRLFVLGLRQLTRVASHKIPRVSLRALVGGTLVIGGMGLLRSTRYAGLGIPSIQEAFLRPASLNDFCLKFIFTILTLASGFKGGEVTPLFFMGATLGSYMAPLLKLPVGLMAGVGLVSVFAGAARVPVAGTLLAFEVLGPSALVPAVVACVVSTLCAHELGLYSTS